MLARLRAEDINPAKTVFYDDLDTVRFGVGIKRETRSARDLTATGSVMLGMLLGDIALILSQAQSYDNQLLLTMISAAGGADSQDRLAFLRLVRAGFVRVGLVQSDPAVGPDDERYTVMNVFRASLANTEFVLSGWPELNSDVDLRREVLDCLDRAPSGRMSTAVPDTVAARVEGLREFDRNLRQSPQGIRLVGRAGGESLEARVGSMLRAMGATGGPERDAAAAVIERARRDAMNLNSRSTWYRLIEWESQESDPPSVAALQVLRDIVDLNYNAMVSESLNDDGMSLSAAQERAASTAADEFTPGQSPGERWADLNPSPGRGDWLRWRDVPDLLDDLQVLSPEGRLTELERRQGDWIARYELAHSWGVSIKIALPGALATAAVPGFAASLITSATPGQAAGVAALTGAATLVAGMPAVRSWRMRRTAREEERLKVKDKRSAIHTGAAGWLERMRGHQ